MNKKSIALYVLTALLVLPSVAFAWTFQSIADQIIFLMQIVFATAAIVYFLWYGVMFLTARGDPSAVATARQGVLWGIVGIIVGVIAIGIVGAVVDFFL